MARQVRNHVAVVTAGLAATALLLGPAIATGLDVAGTTGAAAGQVVSSAQGAVGTVQQTTQSAATTVQQTVQPVVQAAPAPQVVTQVQNTVQTVATAPQPRPQRAPRPSAPARTTPTRASRPNRAATRVVRVAPRQANPVARGVNPLVAEADGPRAKTRELVSKVRDGAKRQLAHTRFRQNAPADAAPSAPACQLPLVSQLLPAVDLGALLTTLCAATNLVILNPSGGSAAQGDDPKPAAGQVLAIVAAAAGSPLHARPLAAASVARAVAGRRATTTGSNGRSGATILGASARGPRVTGARAAVAISPAPAAGAVTPPARVATPAAGHAHHGVFSGPVDGTHTLALILIADLALLAAVLMWRVAQRWVVPRFA